MRMKAMKIICVEDAVGTVLAHDLTKIIPGEFKGAAFKKGHILSEKDIEELKSMGKNHIYVLELEEGVLHEDEAAGRIARAAAGKNLSLEGPSEGKVSLKAAKRGLLKVNIEALESINNMDMIAFSALHNNTLVDAGKTVAGTRIIPLTIEEAKIKAVEDICKSHGSVIWIDELAALPAGIVVTGTEVYEGRIQDKFGPVLEKKIEDYGCTFVGMRKAPDEKERIVEAITQLIAEGAKIVLVSGGMSVDADDVTPKAIEEVSDQVVTYGSPVLPGAMFMLAYKDDVAIMGVPGCAMYHRITILDLVLPRILAGEKVSRRDIARMGHGGLCQNCKVCHYPICTFGR